MARQPWQLPVENHDHLHRPLEPQTLAHGAENENQMRCLMPHNQALQAFHGQPMPLQRR